MNAGSDSVTTFSVDGDTLSLLNVVPSGGQFPASIAVNHDLVYVLNAGGTGSVQGFRIAARRPEPDRRVVPHARPGEHEPAELPHVAGSGRLLARRSTTARDHEGEHELDRRLRREARRNAFADVRREPVRDARAVRVHVRARPARERRGGRELPHDVPARAGRNARRREVRRATARRRCAGSSVSAASSSCRTRRATTSARSPSKGAQPTLLDAVAATTQPGPIDLTSPKGTRFLYAETGINGTVDEFAVGGDGTLTPSAPSPVCRRNRRHRLDLSGRSRRFRPCVRQGQPRTRSMVE